MAANSPSNEKQEYDAVEAEEQYIAWLADKKKNNENPKREDYEAYFRTLGGKRDTARALRNTFVATFAPEWSNTGPKTKLKKIVKNTPPAKLPK